MRITGNRVWGNNGAGIELDGEHFPLLVGNWVTDCKGAGLWLVGCGEGYVDQNHVKGNIGGDTASEAAPEAPVAPKDTPAQRPACSGGAAHFFVPHVSAVGLRAPAPYWRE